MKSTIILGLIIIFMLTTSNVFAVEPIMITISSDMDKVIFDGKWTFYKEWKRSSLVPIFHDGSVLRIAHQGNFIYVMIDGVGLTKFNNNGDRTIICFDINDIKSTRPNAGDYCFMATLGSNQIIVLQGGSDFASTNYYKKIPVPLGVIGVGGVSDQNDRYTDISHETYEFRIPTDLVGRSDKYGFYLETQYSNNIYTWPPQNSTSDVSQISNPNTWGEIISPDKSLPEFPLPLVSLIVGFSVLIYLNNKKIILFRR